MYLENTIHLTLKCIGKVIPLVASATGNSIFVYQNISIERILVYQGKNAF